ncbi:MAG: hypothetical protein U0800_14040 [Isosphaeraceae bacterium]
MASLRKEADGLLARPLLKYEKPDGKRLLSVSRGRPAGCRRWA